MKKYRFQQPQYGRMGRILDEPETIDVTEQDILDVYWPYWKEKMEHKYGKNSDMITHENCIDDYVVVHWAWEIKD